MEGVEKYEFNSFDSIKNKVKELKNRNENCYAIIVEPLSASTLRKSDNRFLSDVRELCDDENIILIYDEIYTGWCKTGNLFNFFSSNTIPDILVYAKSFGGGKASISGYTVREPIMKKSYDNPDDFSLQSSTFSGFGEETITALEAINIIFDEDYIKKSEENGKVISNIFLNIKKKFPDLIDEIRGSGSFQGFTFKNLFNQKIENILLNLIPVMRYRDKNFFKKIFAQQS